MKKRVFLSAIILFAALIRLWKLGSVPDGISTSEANLGIYLSGLFHFQLSNIFILRLPFALFGVYSVYIFCLLIQKLTKNYNLSILASLFLSVSPLHIHESRIYSLGTVIITVLLTVIVLVWNKIEKNNRKIIPAFLIVSLTLFVFSILKIPEFAGQNVNRERNISAQHIPFFLTKLYSNKLIESYEYKKNLFFEHLDFGNYFFSGYPRPRWGVEEIPKIYVVFLPLILIGLFSLDKNTALHVITLVISYWLAVSSFGFRRPTWDLPVLFVAVYFSAVGMGELIVKKKLRIFAFLLIFLLLFESVSFLRIYFIRLTESQFSPRSSIYKRLVPQVREFYSNSKSLYVSNRLSDAQIYFQFYDPDLTVKTEFKDFDLRKDSIPERLFVGVLPFDPSPAEMLYKNFGVWPEYVDVLYVFPDEKMRQDVVVFRSKL